jgi:hypothetical protein
MYLLIHGAYGNPRENWFPWLKDQLEQRGESVEVPQFPTPEGQSLDAWLRVMANRILGEDVTIVAHSLGPLFVLHYLERTGAFVDASFFVAPFARGLGHPIDVLNKSFYAPVNWASARERVGKCTAFYSNNDPYVPQQLSEEFASRLGARKILVPGAGHFNEKAGFITFPLLLSRMLEAK